LDFDLLWTCITAANHKTDHSNELINRMHDVRCTNLQQSTTNRTAVQQVRNIS